MKRAFTLFCVIAFVAAMSGCGKKHLAKVHGKVSFNGQPINAGTLVFSPIVAGDNRLPGKSSTGDIEPDGTYQLSTFSIHDGALPGQHQVRFIPWLEKKKKTAQMITSANYADLRLPASFVVEVKSASDNEIDIELVKSSTGSL